MSMNDRYYEPNQDERDRAWDHFVDYCDSNGLDPEVEDFEEWMTVQQEMAEEAAMERAMDALNDRDYDY